MSNLSFSTRSAGALVLLLAVSLAPANAQQYTSAMCLTEGPQPQCSSFSSAPAERRCCEGLTCQPFAGCYPIPRQEGNPCRPTGADGGSGCTGEYCCEEGHTCAAYEETAATGNGVCLRGPKKLLSSEMDASTVSEIILPTFTESGVQIFPAPSEAASAESETPPAVEERSAAPIPRKEVPPILWEVKCPEFMIKIGEDDVNGEGCIFCASEGCPVACLYPASTMCGVSKYSLQSTRVDLNEKEVCCMTNPCASNCPPISEKARADHNCDIALCKSSVPACSITVCPGTGTPAIPIVTDGTETYTGPEVPEEAQSTSPPLDDRFEPEPEPEPVSVPLPVRQPVPVPVPLPVSLPVPVPVPVPAPVPVYKPINQPVWGTIPQPAWRDVPEEEEEINAAIADAVQSPASNYAAASNASCTDDAEATYLHNPGKAFPFRTCGWLMARSVDRRARLCVQKEEAAIACPSTCAGLCNAAIPIV